MDFSLDVRQALRGMRGGRALTLGFTLVATTAALIPACRAAESDPAAALRLE